MQAIGNKKCNSLYESRAPEKKINPDSSSYAHPHFPNLRTNCRLARKGYNSLNQSIKKNSL